MLENNIKQFKKLNDEVNEVNSNYINSVYEIKLKHHSDKNFIDVRKAILKIDYDETIKRIENPQTYLNETVESLYDDMYKNNDSTEYNELLSKLEEYEQKINDEIIGEKNKTDEQIKTLENKRPVLIKQFFDEYNKDQNNWFKLIDDEISCVLYNNPNVNYPFRLNDPRNNDNWLKFIEPFKNHFTTLSYCILPSSNGVDVYCPAFIFKKNTSIDTIVETYNHIYPITERCYVNIKDNNNKELSVTITKVESKIRVCCNYIIDVVVDKSELFDVLTNIKGRYYGN